MKQALYPKNPILIVDDEVDFLNSIHTTLKRKGITNVELCDKSIDVMPRLKEKKYSLILLDIIMPDIRGNDLLPEIMENYVGIPVIMLTAWNDIETAFQCRKKGARDFLLKPIDTPQLLEKIRDVLGTTEPPQEGDSDYSSKEFNFAEEVKEIIQKSKEQLELNQEPTFDVKTIFLADLVGATAAKDEFGHSKGMKRSHIHNIIAAETIKRFDGKVIKFMGDAVLAAFYFNLDAVVAALTFREALNALNLPGEEFKAPLKTRIILTTGTVEEFNTESGYDIGGQVVDKAARLEKVASPGQILVEAGVIENIRVMLERMPFIKLPPNIDISELQLKGFNDPVRVFEITTKDRPFGNPPSEEGQYFFDLIDAIAGSKSHVLLSTPTIETRKNRKDIGLLQDRLLEAQNQRGVDVRILCSGLDRSSLIAASEWEELGLTVQFCESRLDDPIHLIDENIIIFGLKKQDANLPRNKYLKMTSHHVNSLLAADFQLRWNESIPLASQMAKNCKGIN
ncbi:MAG: response regulator [Candidatus Aminicenantes bacterium]|nr:response regulator [Candidatus Aminicenantes bacterium]